MLANVGKCMEHLRKHEKISTEFLCSENSIVEGDSDVIWGLLNSMWRFYSGKDTRRKACGKPISTASAKTNKNNSPSPINKSQENIKLHTSIEQADYSYLRSMGMNCSLSQLKALEAELLSWLESLGLVQTGGATLVDVEKAAMNGSLLCRLAEVLGNFDVFRANAEPKTRMAVYSNIRNALEAFRKLPGINRRYLWSEREIYNGEHRVVLGLLQDLHAYFIKTKIRTSSLLPPNRSPADEFASALPPSPDACPVRGELAESRTSAVKAVPDVLTDWVRRVLAPVLKIQGPLTADKFRDGVLLARLVEVLESKSIEGIEQRPKTSAASLHNIRKALDTLKSKKSISLEYIYGEQEIYRGNGETVVGLLKSMKCAYHTAHRGDNLMGASSCSAKSFARARKKQQGNSLIL